MHYKFRGSFECGNDRNGMQQSIQISERAAQACSRKKRDNFQTMTKRIFQYPIHVEASAIDVQKHVNNCEYLRWMEAAATRHSAQNGWAYADLVGIGRMWVARQHWVEYLKPAYLGEDLMMYTWVQSIRHFASMRRYALKRGDDLLMVGATEWVFIDSERLRPARLSAEVEASFTVVAPDDPVLRELDIDRPIRFSPSPGLAA